MTLDQQSVTRIPPVVERDDGQPPIVPEYTFPNTAQKSNSDGEQIYVQKLCQASFYVDADTVAEAIAKVIADEEGEGVEKISEEISFDASDGYEGYETEDEEENEIVLDEIVDE